MKLSFEAACGSNTGARRGENEDNIYFGGIVLPESHQNMDTLSGSIELEPEGEQALTVAVFDGMGGQADGQTASYVAARTLQGGLKHGCEPGKLQSFLSNIILAMNQAVAVNARRGNNGMGTTAVILCFQGDRCTVCNVGNSRAYVLRGEKLTQLSKDHTDAETLKRLGTHRKPHLTQYIGMYQDDALPEPFLAEYTVLEGDRFLLCSDGVSDMLNYEELAAIMRSGESPRASVEELIRAALERGGRDNITATVLWTNLVKPGEAESE